MPLISLTDAQHSFLPSILPRCAGTTLNVCDWREMQEEDDDEGGDDDGWALGQQQQSSVRLRGQRAAC